MIELRRLRCVVAAAEHGSLRAAASSLGTTQPSLSRHIRQLEYDIGSTLFLRSPAGVAITPAGERMVLIARQFMEKLSGVADDGNIDVTDAVALRLGLCGTPPPQLWRFLLTMHTDRACRCRLAFVHGHSAAHLAALRRGALDLALLPVSTQQRWDYQLSAPLWNERIFLAMPVDDVLTSYECVEWSQLFGRRFILGEDGFSTEMGSILSARLESLGGKPDVERQAVPKRTALDMTVAGLGLGLLGEAETAEVYSGIAFRPIAGESLQIAAAWMPTNDDPALNRLLAALHSVCLTQNRIFNHAPQFRPRSSSHHVYSGNCG